MKPRIENKYIFPLMGALFLIAAAVIAVLIFMGRVTESEYNQVREHIQNTAKSNAETVSSSFNSYIKLLEDIALSLKGNPNLRSEEVSALLRDISVNEGFERMAINFPDGISYTSDGQIVDFSSIGGMEDIVSGKITIDDVRDALIDGTPIINIHVPIYDNNGVPVAALRAAIATETLEELLKNSLYSGEGYFYILDGNGRYVIFDSRSGNDYYTENFFENIEKNSYEKGYSRNQINQDFKLHTSGNSMFESEGILAYVYYEPVKINNWMSLVLIPEKVVRAQANKSIGYTGTLLIVIVLILLIMFAYVYIMQKKSRDKAELDEEYLRALAEQSGKVIYEWDFDTKHIKVSHNFKSVFGRDITIDVMDDGQSVETGIIYSDDIQTVRNMFGEIYKGNDINGVCFRMLDGMGEYRWCEFHATVVKHKNGKVYKAIATIENIDEQVRREESLRAEGQTDSLTKLLNKKATEYFITETLSGANENHMHALICIDLDDFKYINDSFGHLFGDSVLSDIATTMKKMFRSTDILGRFGGDEFIVFVKDIPDIDFIRDKAAQFCKAVRKTHREGDVEGIISVSMGISIYPQNGLSYVELYARADEAAYKAKKFGKDRYWISQ